MMIKLIPKWEISSRKINNIVMNKKSGMTMKIKNEFFCDLFQLSLFFCLDSNFCLLNMKSKIDFCTNHLSKII